MTAMAKKSPPNPNQPKGETEHLFDRLSRGGEQVLGKIAEDLLERPAFRSALTRAFEARERAVQVQQTAMGALNLPSAADIERLTRRVRSVSHRLEALEDRLDEIIDKLDRSGTTRQTTGVRPSAPRKTTRKTTPKTRAPKAQTPRGKA